MVLNKIKSMFGGNLSGIINGTINAVIVKVVSLIIVFFLNIIVARKFGLEGSGMFFIGITIVHLSSVFSRFGFDFILIKSFSVNKEKKEYFLKNDYKPIRTVVFSLSLLVTIILLFFIKIYQPSSLAINNMYVLIIGITPLSMLTLTSYAFQGIKKVIISMLILSVFWQLLCLIGILYLPNENTLYLCALYVLSLFMAWGVSQKIWDIYVGSVKGKNDFSNVKQYFYRARALWLVSLMNQIIPWSPIIILGIFATVSDVGLFNAAFRVSMLIHFISFVMQAIVSSHISPVIDRKENGELRKIVRKIFYIILFAGTLLALFINYTSELVMSIYGDEFISGKDLLVILVIGQVVNLIGTIAPPLLMMSGREISYRNILVKTSIFSLFCNITFIYYWGTIGAAWAILLAMTFQSSLNIMAVKKHFGFWIPSLVEIRK